jgi:hypothetical protein
VNEHVLAAIVTNDKTEALLSVEELDDSLAFTDDLGRHTATTTSAAAESAATEATATAATSAAEAAAVTAAKTSTIATETAAAEATAIPAKATTETTAATLIVEIVVAETVALILAAPAAATSIKTHALLVTFASPQDQSDKHVGRMTCRIHRKGGFGNHYINFSGQRERFSPPWSCSVPISATRGVFPRSGAEIRRLAASVPRCKASIAMQPVSP